MNRFKNTVDLLKLLSKRLSGRKNLTKTTYRITISEPSNMVPQIIMMNPYVLIYPNIHNKKHSDSQYVLYWALNQIPNVSILDSYGDQVSIDYGKDNLSMFIPGIYEYRRTFDGKYRAWFKIL